MSKKIKCQNCNEKMKIMQEVVSQDYNGNPIYGNYAYCEHCNSRINLPPQQIKEGFSAMSILAFIFSFLCCLSFVGLILGIIDLCTNKNGKKGLSIAAVIISCIMLFSSVIFFANVEENDTEGTSIEENKYDEEETIEYSKNLSYEDLNKKDFGTKVIYAEIKGIVLSKQDEQSYIVAFDDDYNKPFLISTEKELKVNDNIVAQGSVSSKVAVKGLDGNTIMIPQMICDKVGVEKPKLTLEQENAIGSAESYIRYSGFSREGLIDQLEYEGYSTESATFAADYIDVDWNEECKESAKDYLKYSTFSRQGLHDQLQYEGFTEEQIEYGLSAVGY